MAELTTRDLRRALDLVLQLNSDDTDDEVARASLTAFERLVGCDMSGVVGSDQVSRRLTTVSITRPERNMLTRPGFAAAVAHHPGFTAYRSGRLRMGNCPRSHHANSRSPHMSPTASPTSRSRALSGSAHEPSTSTSNGPTANSTSPTGQALAR